MADFQHVEIRPKMAKVQIENMMVHVLRLPELFTLAAQLIQPTFFHSQTETHLMVLWQMALKIKDSYGMPGLFDDPGQAWQLLQTETQAYCEASPEIINEEFQDELFDHERG